MRLEHYLLKSFSKYYLHFRNLRSNDKFPTPPFASNRKDLYVSYLYNNDIINITADGGQHLNTYKVLSTILFYMYELNQSSQASYETGATTMSKFYS